MAVEKINKNIQASGKNFKKHQKAGTTILITDRVELKSKSIEPNKAGHLLMAHVSIHNENITCMSIYSSFNTTVTLRSRTYQQLKGDTSRITVVLGDIT